ncbi:MAG: helix-turn-helix transcriptional regulator [Microcoleus sp. SIO2G3]|nr:helix-turn-helix transcriptional regulator [Microcoleus sp. SIO2G3]
MGRAGKALKKVLEDYDITQNRLAVVMGITRSSVHRWVYEIGDPVADAVIEIRNALQKINPEAAEKFIRLYLGEKAEDEE